MPNDPAWFRHRDLSNGIDFPRSRLDRTQLLFSYVLIRNERPTRELAYADPKADGKADRRRRPQAGPLRCGSDALLPAEYWESVLKDPRADASGAQMRQRRLSEIQRHVLRVSCRRCERTVEIQTADAVRLYGGNAVWKDVAQRLLDNTCQQRTGRHEEDGCWPGFDMA